MSNSKSDSRNPDSLKTVRAIHSMRIPVAVSCIALSLAACTVGPNYKGAPDVAPRTLQKNTFQRTPAQGVSTAPGVAQWWKELNDPILNQLIQTALANNPDIKVSEARLRQSRAGLAQQQDNLLPKLSGSATAIRTQRPDALNSLEQAFGSSTGSGPLQLYSAAFDASWEIDLFGGTRRAVEAATADAQAAQANLADAHVSLAAEVAQAYINLRAQQQRNVITRQSAAYEQQILTLTQQRLSQGVANEADVERAVTQVGTTRASIAPIAADVSESLDRLAVLCGKEPGDLDAILTSVAPLPAVPETVAIGNPADLLQHRPDIRSAERNLAVMNAQIGEKEADYFPKVTLYGALGFSATTPGHLLRAANRNWLGVPYLSWDIFDFGRTRATVRSARAQLDEAQANYQKTVLSALSDADTALSRYGHQRENVVQLMDVETSADRSLSLVEQRYRGGTASLIDMLDVQRTQLSAKQNTLNGQAQLVQDFVAIQKSLGLGWE